MTIKATSLQPLVVAPYLNRAFGSPMALAGTLKLSSSNTVANLDLNIKPDDDDELNHSKILNAICGDVEFRDPTRAARTLATLFELAPNEQRESIVSLVHANFEDDAAASLVHGLKVAMDATAVVEPADALVKAIKIGWFFPKLRYAKMASAYLKDGNVDAAVQAYKLADMPFDAARVLESHGRINDAMDLLLRMRRDDDIQDRQFEECAIGMAEQHDCVVVLAGKYYLEGNIHKVVSAIMRCVEAKPLQAVIQLQRFIASYPEAELAISRSLYAKTKSNHPRYRDWEHHLEQDQTAKDRFEKIIASYQFSRFELTDIMEQIPYVNESIDPSWYASGKKKISNYRYVFIKKDSGELEFRVDDGESLHVFLANKAAKVIAAGFIGRSRDGRTVVIDGGSSTYQTFDEGLLLAKSYLETCFNVDVVTSPKIIFN